MSLLGPYVHGIDPIIGSVFGVHLWWYGLCYALGFLSVFLFIRLRRSRLGIAGRAVYELSLLLAIGALVGGRLVEVVFYEWPFYREHLRLIPALWLGGMATHGILFGGLIGVWVFCRRHGQSFLSVTDALAIPAAFVLAVGRLGNFIDGQIVGSVTNVWWAVKFPDAAGFRHPVVLYDGMKNLLIIPILMAASTRRVPPGVLTGIFLFLYAFLRLFIDLFREYPTTLFGLATGQVLNMVLSIVGVLLIIVPLWRRRGRAGAAVAPTPVLTAELESAGVGWQRVMFALVLLLSLVIPSDWTQDVPARYAKRHPGLHHSALYPKIDPAPQNASPKVHSDETPGQPAPPVR
jgi:phosphatidylglycerol:prolipoprotein diacylglycerol transferase